MAVVTKYGTGARDPASLAAIDGIYAQAERRTINSLISIANGDSIASVLHIGEVPSDCIIDPNSTFRFTAITGLTDLDIGFENDTDALVDGDDVATAGTQTLAGHGTLTTANSNKRAWELANLSSNPGGNLKVLATMNAAATAAGTLKVELSYWKAA